MLVPQDEWLPVIVGFPMRVSQQYNRDLAKVFDSVQVDLQDITLLEQAGRDNLINFANSGVGQIDYEAYLTEVMRVCV